MLFMNLCFNSIFLHAYKVVLNRILAFIISYKKEEEIMLREDAKISMKKFKSK